MISFPCEKCGASLCAPDECTGSDSRCRQCGNLVVVPGIGMLVGRPPDHAAPPWLPLAAKAPGHATTGPAMPTGRPPRSLIVLGSAAVVVLFICVVSVLGLGIWVMTNLEGATKVGWSQDAGGRARFSARDRFDEGGGPNKNLLLPEEKPLPADPQDQVAPIETPGPEAKKTTKTTDAGHHLLNLIGRGTVEARIVSLSMNKVAVAVKAVDRQTTLLVQAGCLFKSQNPSYQDLVVVENLTIPVDTGEEVTLQVSTCCTDATKAAPKNGLKYTLVDLPEDSKLRLLACQLAASSKSMQQKQLEVWSLNQHLPRRQSDWGKSVDAPTNPGR
jgi:hypothetical protein